MAADAAPEFLLVSQRDVQDCVGDLSSGFLKGKSCQRLPRTLVDADPHVAGKERLFRAVRSTLSGWPRSLDTRDSRDHGSGVVGVGRVRRLTDE